MSVDHWNPITCMGQMQYTVNDVMEIEYLQSTKSDRTIQQFVSVRSVSATN